MPLDKNGQHKYLWEKIGAAAPDRTPKIFFSVEDKIDLTYKVCRLLVDKMSHFNKDRKTTLTDLYNAVMYFDDVVCPNQEHIEELANFLRKVQPVIDYPDRIRGKSQYYMRMSLARSLEYDLLGKARIRREEDFNKILNEMYPPNRIPSILE